MTLPNWLSLTRLLLVPFVVGAIVSQGYTAAFVLFVIAAVTDAVDGYIARRFGLESAAGRVLDPCADKALIAGSTIALTLDGLLPIWLAVLVIGRDVAIGAVVVVSAVSWRSISIQPSASSKANTLGVIVLLGFALATTAFALNLGALMAGLTAVVAALTVISGFGYLAGWLNDLASGRAPAR